MSLSGKLERARGYGDIFAVVKEAVQRSLGAHRVGLMLYLGNLPLRVGAFHPLGTNDIVINRQLLEATKPELLQKTHIFCILLHEYLHSLGYADERQVRGLTYNVCVENFGGDHPVVEAALTGPWVDISPEDLDGIAEGMDLELVRDFERIDIGYII